MWKFRCILVWRIIAEVLTFCADKLTVVGNSKHSRVFNFAILLNCRKFDAREIYAFYSKFSVNISQAAGTVIPVFTNLLSASEDISFPQILSWYIINVMFYAFLLYAFMNSEITIAIMSRDKNSDWHWQLSWLENAHSPVWTLGLQEWGPSPFPGQKGVPN